MQRLTIVLEIDGQTVERQPPRATLCASCVHFGDWATGAEWCDMHSQIYMDRKDGRRIVTACNGHEEVEDAQGG